MSVSRNLLQLIIVLLVLILLTSCRSKPEDAATAPASPEPPSPTTEMVDTAEEEEPTELVTIEVTRVVVENEIVVVTPEPEVEEPEPKEITICISSEPESLYPYAIRNIASPAGHVIQGIYEPPYTNLSFEYQARGIEKIPSLEDGDAEFMVAAVEEGDVIVDANGDVVTLRDGTRLFNSAGEEIVFAGEPVEMSQMVVTFSLKPMVWSDGKPVTADDSIFSFELAAD
ncbi:MAG: hypothetical protein ACK2T3_13660, partial [Candidatus Promineifilaceae bacterium]